MRKELLRIQDLSIGYGKGKRQSVVNKRLNGCINSEELVCLLGENGAGKSTLIRTICGFQPALGGEINMQNKNVLKLSEKELALMASVVLTDRIVVPNATVEEMVSLGRSPHTGTMGILSREDKKKVEAAIVQCRIDHKKKEYLTNMSDGEKQKVFIAKALAQDTPLIILDEPTAFLDLPARVETIQLLRTIASESGKSILMSTHDLDLALQLADRLWLMGKEKPLIQGSPEDLLLQNEFQHIFQRKGIEFDNETCSFKVDNAFAVTLPVQANGFEFRLLQRAFARKGVNVVPVDKKHDDYLNVVDNQGKPFELIKEGNIVVKEESVEKLVDATMAFLN
ncbi:ABC transporter ATP-binding protein [Prolixibacteraceae bacterium JC049]|nr:ABC transporter ATP-binding protein [Prolixibacteraceae bacterium JC049]